MFQDINGKPWIFRRCCIKINELGPDWESNWQPLGLQAGTQSIEPHQPGPRTVFFRFLSHVQFCELLRLLSMALSLNFSSFSSFFKTL